MRILYLHNINNIAKTYAHELLLRGYTVAIYEPDLRGGNASLPIKLAMMPQRILDMGRVVSCFTPKHFDIAHIHWASYGILDVVSRIPVIIHCHGSDVRERLNHPFFRPLLIPFFHRASAVLCVTPDILPIVRTIRSDAQLALAPIDTMQFAPDDMKTDRPIRPWTVLLFARLGPEKGSAVAIEGIRRFALRHSGIRVLLLDWGPLRQVYKQQYARQFEFFSPVPANQARSLILSADVVVGQFALGALGLSELQAMSCAKPVIASFHYQDAYPAPPPLCQATTAEEVDEWLENLFQHPEVATMLGQKAREWVIRYHDCQSLSYEIEKLYQKIVGRDELCVV